MISRLRIDSDGFIHYDLWRNIPADKLRQGNVLEYLKQDLLDNQLSLNDINNYPWIIDLNLEGHNELDIEAFRQLLCKHGVTQFGAVFSSYVDTQMLPYPAVCLPDRIIVMPVIGLII